MDLTDEQWAVLQSIIPTPPRRPDGRGRPWREAREVLNGILWILRTGAQWKDLPERYPPYQTCHRRFQHWVRSGVFERLLYLTHRRLPRSDRRRQCQLLAPRGRHVLTMAASLVGREGRRQLIQARQHQVRREVQFVHQRLRSVDPDHLKPIGLGAYGIEGV